MKEIVKLVVAAFLLATGCRAAAQTEPEFTQEMLARFQAAYPKAMFSVGQPLELRRRNGTDWELRIRLNRIWSHCQNNPDDCENAKGEYVRQTSMKDPVEGGASSLRVVIRPQIYIDQAAALQDQHKSIKGQMVAHRKVGDDIYALLASDSPSQILMVDGKRLEEMGLDEEAAFELALSQSAKASGLSLSKFNLAQKIVPIEATDYGSAIIFDSPEWQKASEKYGPDLYMAIISDHLTLAGTLPPGPDFETVKEIAKEECNSAQRCISDNLYRFRKGTWVIAP